MTTTPPRTTYELAHTDVQRVLVAIALTSLTVWLAWAVPVADWVLGSIESASIEAVRVAAARDAVTQGWWAIIVVTVAMTIGSALAVAVDHSRGRSWTVTALQKAIRLASTVVAMWAIWTVSVLAAAEVQTIG
ncbi:hypothetical protein [Rhodococcus sp. IEGM 1374]|uniref:hypothetical protein n=1 Tax=Rhodococcus sp. IEGM 1374 TaxID=3082221 RepID=UPI0029530C26|nr:hypothetical protein [Rhodococcus sp. IEGM 1374]MDV7991574.1 hypothetical protein [Rhodococcus sp. IEGM 1374]